MSCQDQDVGSSSEKSVGEMAPDEPGSPRNDDVWSFDRYGDLHVSILDEAGESARRRRSKTCAIAIPPADHRLDGISWKGRAGSLVRKLQMGEKVADF